MKVTYDPEVDVLRILFRDVPIEESDTEMDCLHRVLSTGEPANPQYFEALTTAWMIQAYALSSPDDELMQRIWSQWPFGEGGRS